MTSVEDAPAQLLEAKRRRAYAPELPGCIATGKSWKDIQAMLREAIAFHIEGLPGHGDSVPEPRMSVGEARAYHFASLSDAEEPVP